MFLEIFGLPVAKTILLNPIQLIHNKFSNSIINFTTIKNFSFCINQADEDHSQNLQYLPKK